MSNQNTVDLLLVEDRPEDAELALMALKRHKLLNNIKWVKDGQEALDFLFFEGAYAHRKGAANPKLILLDIKMPKVSGLEVIEAVRKNPTTKTIPIVALTTSREQNDRLDAYNLGANSYIVKPVEFENFSECVRELGFYWLLLNEPPLK
ncbi:response regulator [Crocinitomicaceae bacterium]|nr:response regulator [Crocinitomicaceae bacterium]MDB3907673.1 response regulator [Crocinitomicaceae bacterium]